MLNDKIKQSKRGSHGFTIVELLIVIVVIAVLAAIVIVVFNDVQRRAQNTTRISNADTHVKTASAFAVTSEGAMMSGATSYSSGNPVTPRMLCLHAVPAPDTNCINFGSSYTPLGATALSNFKLGEGKYSEAIPFSDSLSMGTAYIEHSVYTLDGDSSRMFIVYGLEGANEKCGGGQLVRSVHDYTTGPNGISYSQEITRHGRFFSMPAGSQNSYSSSGWISGKTITECWIAVPENG